METAQISRNSCERHKLQCTIHLRVEMLYIYYNNNWVFSRTFLVEIENNNAPRLACKTLYRVHCCTYAISAGRRRG